MVKYLVDRLQSLFSKFKSKVETTDPRLIAAEQKITNYELSDALQELDQIDKEKLNTLSQLKYDFLKSSIFQKTFSYREAYELSRTVITDWKDNPTDQEAIILYKVIGVRVWSSFFLDKLSEIIKELENAERFFQNRSDNQLLNNYKTTMKFLKGSLYLKKGDLEKAQTYLEEVEKIRSKLENNLELISTLTLIGMVYGYMGKIDLALKKTQESLELSRKINNLERMSGPMNNVSFFLFSMGELDKALEGFKECLIFAEKMNDIGTLATILANIGEIYYQKGKIDLALEYAERSLVITEKIGRDEKITEILLIVVRISLDKSQELAEKYLEQLKEINYRSENVIINLHYRLAKAYCLKNSKKERNKLLALEIFEEVAKEEIVNYEFTVYALLNQCELLFFEFKTFGKKETLKEIRDITTKMTELAKQNQSHWLLAETYLLISMLNLVELNVKEARKYLYLAQTFAEEKGLRLLAKRISQEHDKMLDTLNEWEQISEEEVDLLERAKKVDLEKQIKVMTRHEEVKTQEEEEKPVQLMLLSAGGVSFYSREFDPKITLDELLVGGLMTAIYSFSSEVFSQALERLKIGSYTIIIQRNEPILFCYVYEGQSYNALHKVNTLSSAIFEDKKIIKNIDKRTKTGTKLKGEYKKTVDHLIDDLFVAQTS